MTNLFVAERAVVSAKKYPHYYKAMDKTANNPNVLFTWFKTGSFEMISKRKHITNISIPTIRKVSTNAMALITTFVTYFTR